TRGANESSTEGSAFGNLAGWHSVDILGLQPFVTGDDVKFDFFTFIQGLESGTQYGGVMHKDILSRVLGDKPKTFLVVEPFYFAAGHRRLSPDQSAARHQKKKT